MEEKRNIVSENRVEDIILVGYGGHAKSVADCVVRQNKYRIIGYTDFEPRNAKHRYLGTDAVLKDYFDQGVKNAVIGIGYMGTGELRVRLYEFIKGIGYSLPVIADPSAIISETASVGEGAFIGKGAIVNAEAVVGKMAIVNTMALVEHECVVGDFTHVAVGAVLCGQVRVGNAVLVGANATILQCIDIPSNKIIPAGETIRRNYHIPGDRTDEMCQYKL